MSSDSFLPLPYSRDTSGEPADEAVCITSEDVLLIEFVDYSLVQFLREGGIVLDDVDPRGGTWEKKFLRVKGRERSGSLDTEVPLLIDGESLASYPRLQGTDAVLGGDEAVFQSLDCRAVVLPTLVRDVPDTLDDLEEFRVFFPHTREVDTETLVIQFEGLCPLDVLDEG